MSSLWWTAILLLALTVSMCYGVPTYQDFLYKHVDFPKTSFPSNAAYCNVMMVRRGMTAHGRCKSFNTFVHTDPRNLNTLCINQPDQALRTTRRHFRITDCKLIRSHPTCRYSGNQFNRRVRVGCWGGLPVHLDGTSPWHFPLGTSLILFGVPDQSWSCPHSVNCFWAWRRRYQNLWHPVCCCLTLAHTTLFVAFTCIEQNKNNKKRFLHQ